MNYAKISTIVTLVSSIVIGTYWFASNVVMASDFQQYQTEQQVRWLQYDRRAAWQEYISLRQLANRTPNENKRMLELEGSIKDLERNIQSLRDHK